MNLAITDLINAAKTVTGLEVVEEVQENNRNNYTLVITQGERVRESRFGPDRITQSLNMFLHVKQPSPSGVSDMIGSIETAILADRRRDGNAQTTINPTAWVVQEDNGREGQILTSDVGIVVYES